MAKVDLKGTVSTIKGHVPIDPEWLGEPYAGLVTVKGIQYSETKKYKNGDPYNGVPYFKYLVHTENDKHKYYITLWRPSGSEDPKGPGKLDRIKKFLDNLNADETLDDQEYLESVIGNQCQVVIQQYEEVDLREVPKINNRLSFWFSKRVEEDLDMDLDRMHRRLTPAEMEKFEIANTAYAKAHPEEKEEKSAIDKAKGAEDF